MPHLLITILMIGMLLLCRIGAAMGEMKAPTKLPVKSYACLQAPNYWGWKGPNYGDRGQLTDGVILNAWENGEGKEYYACPQSIGWMSFNPVVVIFDLGQVQSIGGIGIHSALSWWGPYWPAEIAVLVSDDNQDFYLAGPPHKIVPEELDPPLTRETVQAAIDRTLEKQGRKPSTHWERVTGLKARGRYVSLILTSPDILSLDEIEIYAGEPEFLQLPRPTQLYREGKGGWKSYLLGNAVRLRLSRDIESLKEKIAGRSLAKELQDSLYMRLERIQARLSEIAVPNSDTFRAILPVDALHREIFKVQAALWNAQKATAICVWKGHRWDPLSPLDEPCGKTPTVNILIAEHEVRSDVLNLSNATQRDCTVKVSFSGLPTKHIQIFEVLTVDTKKLEPVTAALVPAVEKDGIYRITVPAGMTRQVWLRCSSKGLNSGKYEGAIRLSCDTEKAFKACIEACIEVVPVRLPDRFTLRLGGWDYAIDQSYQVTEENKDDFVAMLREYGVNTPWATGSVMPPGTYDSKGNLTAPPLRKQMDTWLRMWPNADLYCIASDGVIRRDDPNRADKLAAWAKDWADYLRSKGIPASKLALLIQDEPNTASELQYILETGRAVKRGAPDIKIWNDLHFDDPAKAPPVIDQVMQETCDVECFALQHHFAHPVANDAFRNKHRRPGLEWWTYTGGANDRLTDPYVSCLLRQWFCFDKKLNGSHFWAFGDSTGGFSWNEYLNSGVARTPLYLAADSVTTAKYMEAIREGMQDYELLSMLEQELGRHAGSNSAAVGRARQVLEQGVRNVLAAHNMKYWAWQIPKDRSQSDRVRARALRSLLELRRQPNRSGEKHRSISTEP